MRRGQVIIVLLLLMVAAYDFGVTPLRLAQSFAAMRCCMEHCRKAVSMSSAERCCGVVQDHASTRVVQSTPSGTELSAQSVFLVTVEQGVPPAQTCTREARTDPARASPLFVTNQVFLL